MHNNGRILGANGAPTKLDLRVQYSPGPLVTPVVFPPLSTDDGVVAPTFGGATRMETVASRLLAGAMDPETLERCRVDASYRRYLIEAAVLTAWETIGAASEYRGAASDDPPADAPDEKSEGAPSESELADTEPENRSGIVLPGEF